MVSFLDVIERASTGKICSEKDFDLKIFTVKLRDVIRKYGVSYDPDIPVPSDPGLADSVFKAAFEFFCDVGAYCIDTQRIISFDEGEVKERLRTAPSQVTLGEGLDRKTLTPRRPEDPTPPWCFLGAAGVAVSSDDIFLKLVEGYGRIPYINSVTTPALTRVAGMRIRPGSPLEVLGAMRTVVLAREALRRAGRPGLPIMNTIATASTAVSLISALHPDFGLRKSDGVMIGAIAELKTNFDLLNRACVANTLGMVLGVDCGPLFGGYCGGAEGTAIVTAAYHIMTSLVYHASWYVMFPIHVKYSSSSTPELIWSRSVSAQAISRNTHLPSLYISYTASGPCTDTCLYEIAAQISSIVASGASIEAAGIAKGKYEDRMTPMEPRFAAEVAHATAGMKLRDVNDIVKKLIPKYIDKMANPPLGLKFQECYDIETGKPSSKYLEIYGRVKRELEDLGIKFKP